MEINTVYVRVSLITSPPRSCKSLRSTDRLQPLDASDILAFFAIVQPLICSGWHMEFKLSEMLICSCSPWQILWGHTTERPGGPWRGWRCNWFGR